MVLEAVQSVDDPRLDLIGSLVGVLGNIEVTGLAVVLLATVWRRREGGRGLVPLLLFAGVALELVMKFLIPHAAPEGTLRRSVDLGPFVEAPAPFSFPSGHLFRTGFVATIVAPRLRAIWRVALVALVI